MLPSNPAFSICNSALSTNPHSTEKTKLIFTPSSFPESYYVEILADIGISHQDIFLVSIKGTCRVLAIKLSAVGQGALKTAVSSGVMR